MKNEVICVVCDSPLFSERELDEELCNGCAGRAESLNKNKSKEEIEDVDGDNPVGVDRILNRGRPLNFSDFEMDPVDDDDEEEQPWF